MAVEYVGSQCWYKYTYDNGSMEIRNGYCYPSYDASCNSLMKQYNEHVAWHDGDYDSLFSSGYWYNYTGETYWDYPQEKVNHKGSYLAGYDSDGNEIWKDYTYWTWEYIYDANGNHPTVSSSGANLTGGSGNDTIEAIRQT